MFGLVQQVELFSVRQGGYKFDIRFIRLIPIVLIFAVENRRDYRGVVGCDSRQFIQMLFEGWTRFRH